MRFVQYTSAESIRLGAGLRDGGLTGPDLENHGFDGLDGSGLTIIQERDFASAATAKGKGAGWAGRGEGKLESFQFWRPKTRHGAVQTGTEEAFL